MLNIGWLRPGHALEGQISEIWCESEQSSIWCMCRTQMYTYRYVDMLVFVNKAHILEIHMRKQDWQLGKGFNAWKTEEGSLLSNRLCGHTEFLTDAHKLKAVSSAD